jgi:hypothetical protein
MTNVPVKQRAMQVAERVEPDEQEVRVTIAPRAEDPEAFYSWSADTEQQVNQENMPQGGGRQVIEAQYLVGCDGGKSLVRESMGIDRGGRNFDQRMVLAVFRSRELHEALKRFPESTTYRVMKPELEGYWQFFGRIDVGEGWFFHAPVPENARVDTFDFVALLHEAAGFPFHAELEHVGFWDLRIAVASQYRKGRVFIAGDACHQHPPYGIRRRRHRKSALPAGSTCSSFSKPRPGSECHLELQAPSGASCASSVASANRTALRVGRAPGSLSSVVRRH